ncbi:acyltransferase 3 [Minicystis rosea]|nr:acyltransferase 3 [Minicystis rosea]
MTAERADARHLPALDGLRGIAVLLVLWEHLPDSLTGPGLLAFVKRWVMPGPRGVDIFFVLSGFLITRILLADKARGMPLKSFLVRRFLRIFPIYYLTILAVLAYEPGPNLVYCALYLGNFYWAYHPTLLSLHHTWSLSVEEHFYLLWPLIVYRLPFVSARRVAIWGFIPFALACGLLLWRLDGTVPGWQLMYMSTFTRMGSLALGAAFAFHEGELRGDRRHALRVGGVLAVLAVLAVPFHLRVTGCGKLFALLVCSSAISGICVLVAIRLNDGEWWPRRFLTNGFLRFVGRISYGLYIYHYPIYRALGLIRDDPDPNLPKGFSLLAVGGTFVLATVSYYGLEQRILRLKDRFREPALPAVERGVS